MNLESDPELQKSFRTWSASRQAFIEKHFGELDARGNPVWQKHYTRGVGPGGETAPEHQVKLAINAFVEKEPPIDSAAMKTELPAALTGLSGHSASSRLGRFKQWLRFMLGSLNRWTY